MIEALEIKQHRRSNRDDGKERDECAHDPLQPTVSEMGEERFDQTQLLLLSCDQVCSFACSCELHFRSVESPFLVKQLVKPSCLARVEEVIPLYRRHLQNVRVITHAILNSSFYFGT